MHRTPYRKNYKNKVRCSVLDRSYLKQLHLKNTTFDSAPRVGCSFEYDPFIDSFLSVVPNNPEVSNFSFKPCPKGRSQSPSTRTIVNKSKASSSYHHSKQQEKTKSEKKKARKSKQPLKLSASKDSTSHSEGKEPLMHRLVQNSLELVRLSEVNLSIRRQLLGEYEEQLQSVWDEFVASLKEADNSNRNQVQQALQYLVRQRMFLDNQKQRISSLLEEVKL